MSVTRSAELPVVADAIVMLTIHLGVASLEKRGADLEVIADLLARAAVATLAEPGAAARAASPRAVGRRGPRRRADRR